MDARRARDDGGKDQGHDHHADKRDEQLAEGLQVRGGKVGRGDAAHDNAQHQADDHLCRQA